MRRERKREPGTLPLAVLWFPFIPLDGFTAHAQMSESSVLQLPLASGLYHLTSANRAKSLSAV
jgi:hypothetical protein